MRQTVFSSEEEDNISKASTELEEYASQDEQTASPDNVGNSPFTPRSRYYAESNIHQNSNRRLNTAVMVTAESFKVSQFLALVERLLLRKRRILECVKYMNDYAQAMISQHENEASKSFTYSSSFQSQYAWLLSNLDVTNKALDPAMEQFFADASIKVSLYKNVVWY